MSLSTPFSHRCSTCQSASVNPRNLAVFIDDTSDNSSDRGTNVRKLFYQVQSKGEGSDPEQHIYYLKGIGAHGVDNRPLLNRVGKATYRLLEMAFAWNVEENVKDAYTWLAETYREGDQIYLFGFSRGAYEVQILASMIHLVGLVKEKHRVDVAYARYYLHIDPHHTEKRRKATMFKKEFCWPGVKVHFVGLWDMMSSLGIIKGDPHVTASSAVTDACHVRHALALDERRVKFMPGYFTEVNPHRNNVRSSRSAIGCVKEVWFAGSHSDIGGTSWRNNQADSYSEDSEHEPPSAHAGNVPLLWMRREAAANGLVFRPVEFTWVPEDVDLGRKDTMTFLWKFLEFLPIRHQVSHSGTGLRERRWHLSRPRAVIPGQQIHSSVLSGDVYTPRATLRDGIYIPTAPQNASDELWTTDLPDEGATTRLLTALLSDQQKTLGSLEKVLFILDSMLASGQAPMIPPSQWSIDKNHSDSDKFALTVIYDVLSNFSISEELVKDARDTLCSILSSSSALSGAFYVLRFSTKHEVLRRRFIAHNEVIGAIVRALEWTAKNPNQNTFLLVIDSLRCLINDDDLRSNVINQFSSTSVDSVKTGRTRLLTTLEVKAPSQLVASLKMITSFAQYRPDPCRELTPKIIELAATERNLVGFAAVEALVTLNVPLTSVIHISNILGFFDSTLPPLDIEVGSTSLSDDTGDLPPVLQVKRSGKVDEEIMRKLVVTIESHDTRQRIAATLTLLKLYRNQMIRDYCSRNNVLHIFMRQLERKETSLLAAYALKMWLERGSDADIRLPDTSRLIVAMVNKGWFDDAIGRVEGFEIFRGLMQVGCLRRAVIDLGIVSALVKKLEDGKRHDVRIGLICLDILESENTGELPRVVDQCIAHLTDKDKRIQRKGVQVLSALAQTAAGEQAIKPRVIDIVTMMLPSSGQSSSPPSQLFGPAAALYDLSRNETLREVVKASKEFSMLQASRRTITLSQ